jgi:hypothetical protein
MPGGLATARLAPAASVGYVALKFDAAMLHARIKELAAELLPGTEGYLDPALAEASEHLGVDIVGEVLPALGDEIGLFVFPPQGSPMPQGVLLVKVRDEEKLGSVLAVARDHLTNAGVEVRSLRMTDGGPDGFWLSIPEAPVQPAFAVRNGYLVGAVGPAQLREFVRDWQERVADGNDLASDEVYRKVLAGLGAGNGERLAVLGFVNLRRAIPPGLNLGLPFLGMIPGIEEWMDLGLVPDPETVAGYFSGVAYAIQRDGDALSFDVFSPSGMMLPGAVASLFMIRVEQEKAREMREEARREAMEEMRRREEEARAAAEAARERAAMADDPFIGFNVDQATVGGVGVLSILDGTPAASSDLRAGDLIVKLGESDTPDFATFREVIGKHRPGQTVTLTVVRGGEQIRIELTLGRRGDFER